MSFRKIYSQCNGLFTRKSTFFSDSVMRKLSAHYVQKLSTTDQKHTWFTLSCAYLNLLEVYPTQIHRECHPRSQTKTKKWYAYNDNFLMVKDIQKQWTINGTHYASFLKQLRETSAPLKMVLFKSLSLLFMADINDCRFKLIIIPLHQISSIYFQNQKTVILPTLSQMMTSDFQCRTIRIVKKRDSLKSGIEFLKYRCINTGGDYIET